MALPPDQQQDGKKANKCQSRNQHVNYFNASNLPKMYGETLSATWLILELTIASLPDFDMDIDEGGNCMGDIVR